MVISKLIKQLEDLKKQHGDIEVMQSDFQHSESIAATEIVGYRIVEENEEFPEDWNMPKGFKFVELSN